MGWALVAYFLCWTLSPFLLPKVRRRHHTVVLLSRFLKVLVGEPHLQAVTLHEPRSDLTLANSWHLHMHGCQISMWLASGSLPCEVASAFASPVPAAEALTANFDHLIHFCPQSARSPASCPLRWCTSCSRPALSQRPSCHPQMPRLAAAGGMAMA